MEEINRKISYYKAKLAILIEQRDNAISQISVLENELDCTRDTLHHCNTHIQEAERLLRSLTNPANNIS